MEDFNRMIIAQIDAQLKQGYESNLRKPEYCVVKTGVNQVLVVLPAHAVVDTNEAVFGPKPFADCLSYVNGQLVNEPFRQPGDDEPHEGDAP